MSVRFVGRSTRMSILIARHVIVNVGLIAHRLKSTYTLSVLNVRSRVFGVGVVSNGLR